MSHAHRGLYRSGQDGASDRDEALEVCRAEWLDDVAVRLPEGEPSLAPALAGARAVGRHGAAGSSGNDDGPAIGSGGRLPARKDGPLVRVIVTTPRPIEPPGQGADRRRSPEVLHWPKHPGRGSDSQRANRAQDRGTMGPYRTHDTRMRRRSVGRRREEERVARPASRRRTPSGQARAHRGTRRGSGLRGSAASRSQTPGRAPSRSRGGRESWPRPRARWLAR
jgi:hypothetical protein